MTVSELKDTKSFFVAYYDDDEDKEYKIPTLYTFDDALREGSHYIHAFIYYTGNENAVATMRNGFITALLKDEYYFKPENPYLKEDDMIRLDTWKDHSVCFIYSNYAETLFSIHEMVDNGNLDEIKHTIDILNVMSHEGVCNGRYLFEGVNDVFTEDALNPDTVSNIEMNECYKNATVVHEGDIVIIEGKKFKVIADRRCKDSAFGDRTSIYFELVK